MVICYLKNKVSGNLRAKLNNQEYLLHVFNVSKIGMEINSHSEDKS